MVETITQEATPQSVDSAQAPAGMPDISDKSPSELAAILDKLHESGGEQAQGTPPPATPEGEKPAQPAPAVQIPDKFKNADGTVNTEALTKSYIELEKTASQMFQERSEYRKAQEQLAEMSEYVKRLDEWREQMTAQPEKAEGEYTPEEIEEMQKNPRSFIQKEVKRGLESFQKEQDAERKLSQQINEAVNFGRANMDGFKILEPKIAEALNSPAYNRHPDSVEEAYYAQLGRNMNVILKSAKDSAFTEGYNKHKEEMERHVEGGGKSTIPVEAGSLTKEQIDGMSIDDLRKLLPRIDNSVQRDERI